MKTTVPRVRDRRRRHAIGHAVVGAWLAAVLVVSFGHPFVPHPRWLLVHLLLLGAVSSAVLIWSGHFAATLLRVREDDAGPGTPGLRLAMLNVGAVIVITGLLTGKWPVLVAGATVVAAAVLAHAAALARAARRALAGRFRVVVRYYVAAALLLAAGAGLGVVLARPELDGDLEARLRLAHEVVNLLGWLGLTIVGTLTTLWPTVLRTRMADGAEQAARRALPVLLAGIVLTAGAALAAPPYAAAPGLLSYAAGLALVARPIVAAARRRPPASVAAWSLLAGFAWLAASLATLVAVVVTSGTWIVAGERLGALTAPLAVGWVAQTLFGALSYLVPVLVGGGPRVARASGAVLERGGPARVTAANLALAVAVLPVSSAVRVVCSIIVLALLVTYPVLMLRAVVVGRAARRPEDGADIRPDRGGDRTDKPTDTGINRLAGVACGLAVVALAVGLGGTLEPTGRPALAAAGTSRVEVTPTGRTTTVTVRAHGMRFSPDRVEVAAGDRLVVVLKNTGDDQHDLVLANGARTPRLPPGESHTLDAGVIGADLDGWCSVVGHRQMGMVLTVTVTGSVKHSAHDPPVTVTESEGRARFDPMAAPRAGFVARDPRLAPLPPAKGPNLHRRTLTVREVELEVAPGVRQRMWTYDGMVPGPVLHGRVGDTFEITLVNAGSIGHSIDFHAGALAPGPVMRTIQPGESLVYRFTASRSGIWMYHCSTMPMSLHLANGMFGAVVIDPPGLPPADREYVLLQSELYLGPPGGTADVASLRAEQPDAVVFNGFPAQYAARPIPVRTAERVRIWVLAAGPNRGTAFHVVGGQFDTLFAEGAYRLRPDDHAGGAQVLDLGPAAGGFVELSFPEAGIYPFVSHRMVDAERGARGAFNVSTASPGSRP